MQSSIKLGNWSIRCIQGDSSDLVAMSLQTHGRTIVQASSCKDTTVKADGVIGTMHDGSFGIHTADCLPLVVITDTRAAAIHISRHTLVAGILDELTLVLKGEQIRGAYIGPHICEKCFAFEEKGPGIIQFESLFPYAVQDQDAGTHISLDAVVTQYLLDQGISSETITRDTRCTVETKELNSYRRWKQEGGLRDFPRMVTAVSYI